MEIKEILHRSPSIVYTWHSQLAKMS